MRITPELGLVIGIVLMVIAVLIIVQAAGDPTSCRTPESSTTCGGAR